MLSDLELEEKRVQEYHGMEMYINLKFADSKFGRVGNDVKFFPSFRPSWRTKTTSVRFLIGFLFNRVFRDWSRLEVNKQVETSCGLFGPCRSRVGFRSEKVAHPMSGG